MTTTTTMTITMFYALIILRSHSGSNFRLCPRACFLNSCFSLGPIMPLVDCIVAMNTLMVLGVYEQDGFEKSQAKYAKAAKLVRKLRKQLHRALSRRRSAFTKKKWWAKARLRVKKGVQKRIMKLKFSAQAAFQLKQREQVWPSAVREGNRPWKLQQIMSWTSALSALLWGSHRPST